MVAGLLRCAITLHDPNAGAIAGNRWALRESFASVVVGNIPSIYPHALRLYRNVIMLARAKGILRSPNLLSNPCHHLDNFPSRLCERLEWEDKGVPKDPNARASESQESFQPESSDAGTPKARIDEDIIGARIFEPEDADDQNHGLAGIKVTKELRFSIQEAEPGDEERKENFCVV